MKLRFPHRLSWPLLAVTIVIGLFAASSTVVREESEERERGFDDPLAARRWVQLAEKDEFGNITPNGLMIAKAQADAIRSRQKRAFARFGPGPLPSIGGINNGGWSWIGPGNVGGRTRAIAINPNNTQEIFAGGVAGGIWRTDNAGASWSVVDDFMANLAVSSMFFKPGDASMMFAATGEGFFNSDSIRGAGIFRSNDGGTSWSQLGSTAGNEFLYVTRLAFSADGSTLLATTGGPGLAGEGIWRSTDNGDSWSQRLSQTNMTDVKFLPGTNTLAVASGFARNAYWSNDAGQTWTLSIGLNGGGGSNTRVELGVSVSSPTTVYASYAAGGTSSSIPAQLWKSLDGGISYSQVVPDPNHLSAQGWYDNAVWVDPTNVNHVVIAGVSRFRSTNGTNFAGMGGSIHVDHHIILSDPGYDGGGNRRVYYGNDGGVYRLEDANPAGGFVFTNLNNNYGVTQFYGGAGQNATGKIFGGTQDNGTKVYTPAGGPQGWTTMAGGDGGYATADQTDSNYLYGEFQWLGVHRSTNGGSSSSTITGCGGPAPLQDSCDDTTNFISPILLDPNNPHRLFGGGQSLWLNSDPRNSSNWAVVKSSVGSNISAIAIAVGNSDLIWIGHNNGNVYKTTNGTAGSPTWNLMDTGLPNRVVTSIAIDPANSDIVWASFGGFSSGNVWRSTDGGASWSDRSSGLPSAPIRSVVTHPTTAGWVYVGTDVGVFASENGGASWGIPHDGPANVAVFQLFFMNTTLVAVTHGRGMFTANVSDPPPAITQHPANRSIVAGANTTFTAAATGTGPITWQWQRWNGSAWANLTDVAPYSGTTTPTLTITNASAGLSASQYRAVASNLAGSTPTNAALLTVYGAGVTVLQNGDFSGGMTGWQVFEVPDIQFSIVGGVFQYYKQSPTQTPSGQAVVYQHSGIAAGAGTPFTATFDLGNSSTVRKRITVIILDSNFSDLHVCTFFLGPGAPLRTYSMKTHSNQAWANTAIYFYAASGGSNGGNYLVDNVSLRYDPAASTTRTDCIDPTAPTPPGGAPSANLLTNGDFGTGALAPWGTFGTITWQISGGVFEFHKPSSTPPAGVLLQTVGAMPAGQILTTTFQLGNSSPNRRRVTLILNDADFSDLMACTFWLTPNQPLSTYTMRVFTTEAWGNAMFSLYSATVGAFQWARFDNAVFQTTPASTALGTECIEPPPPPAPTPAPVPFDGSQTSGDAARPLAYPSRPPSLRGQRLSHHN
jgi:hypothetical protein